MEQKTNDLQKELNKHEKKAKIYGAVTIIAALLTTVPGSTMHQTPSRIDDFVFTVICCLMTAGVVKFLDTTKERDKIYNKIQQRCR